MFTIRAFDATEAQLVARWAYEPPFDLYNGRPDDTRLFTDMNEDGYGYYAVIEEPGNLVGFCCFGPEARVKGQDGEPGTLDIGGGVRPDKVSQGLATMFFPSVLDFGRQRFAPARFRIAVAAFNSRSARLCQSAGFHIVRRFEGPGDREFLELVLPAH